MAVLTNSILLDLLVLVSSGVLIICIYFKWLFTYWAKRGVPTPIAPEIPFGNTRGMSFSKSIGEITQDWYEQSGDNRFFGAFAMTKPVLIPKDLDLIKNMLVKDFSNFHDRGFMADLNKEPLAGHLFLMNGQEWRNLRIKLTPTFTSGKMKQMFPVLSDVGNNLIDVLNNQSTEPEVEVKEIFARYTTDVISSVAFGLESNSLKNPDSEFRQMGLKLAEKPFLQVVMSIIIFAMPGLLKYVPIPLIPKKVSDYFIGIVDETMEYRLKNNVKRNDFLQLLLQLKTLGYIPDADNPEKNEELKQDTKFTVEQAAAQAFLFFFAGFETSSATMQFALYELALNPELQERVREEIKAIKESHDEKITYEALQKMDLLDRVVAETLRKYPVANILLRECNTDYKIPDSDTIVPKGTSIWIPIMGIHNDPKHYPKPAKFDPDRFLPEAKETRHHFAYLPFGEGPRNCIGNRFGLMQSKAGLAIVLDNFSFAPSKRTLIPMVFDPKADIMQAKGGMFLKINKLNN